MIKATGREDGQENVGKVIDVVDARADDFRERALVDYTPFAWTEADVNGRKMRLPLAEALVQQPDASNMLRQDFRYVAFTAFSEMPTTYGQFCDVMSSSKPEEYYLRDAAMGVIPRSRSGEQAVRLLSSFEGSAVVQNFRYAGIVSVLGDDILFDRIGKITQTAQMLGRSARMTEETEVYRIVTTTANYTRTAAAGDNDIGANTGATTFTHVNFEDAMSTISTGKDRKSGQYLGFMADTLICGPRMEWAVRKFLNSGSLNLAADGSSGTVVERGDLNVYRSAISRIVVSPIFSNSYEWALTDSRRRGLMFQQVQPFNVIQTTMTPDNNRWFEYDTIDFQAIGYFGAGFTDDRMWYYSTNTTRPTL